MPKSGSSRTTQTESSDCNSNMVEKQTGRKNKEKVSSYNRTPKIDRSELEKEVKEKASMKRKLPFTVSPSRSEQRESDTDGQAMESQQMLDSLQNSKPTTCSQSYNSDPGHSSETWGERLIPPYRTYTEKEGPEKKKMKKEPGNKKTVPVCKATLGGILIGYPLSERQQMALVMQMTARDNNSTPNHPSQATPGQKKTPSSSSRQKDKVNKRNERGETPLHMAAIRGETKQVKELISQGADVNVKDFAGWTPLHEACNLGYYEVAKQLILAGADVNTQGLDNDTPLHDAASNGHRDIVKLLLRNGGDAYQMNHRGERPVDVADSDEMEQLLKGELPLSDDDDDDSCTESEELPSVNPSSIDDIMDDSEPEKELKTDTNQQLTPCKSLASSAVDEYEFKDDDDDEVEEEEMGKLVDQKRIRRKDGKKNIIKENSSYLTPPKLELQKPFKIKKQKSARVLVSSSSESSDDELHQEKKTCSTSSLEVVPDGSKSDVRTKKENLATIEQKEKGKGKKKVKKQSKNKENHEFKQEKEEKENAKLMLFSTCSSLDSLERTREEDSFRKSLCMKDDSSGHQFHLSTSKSPKHVCGFSEKRAKPLKQENTKTGPSTGTSDISFQSEVVRFDHLTDSDYTSESSSNKSFKYKAKTKYRKKDIHVEFGEKSGSRSKEEETDIFDNMEEVFKKTDKDGKIIKKHKLKHKDKEKNKVKKEHENERGKHRQKESEKDVYPEFDREYWKENFFKNDDTNEIFKEENSDLAPSEKSLKDKTPVKEEKTKEKYFKEERSFKEDREKEKSKKNKKEKHFKEEKDIKLANLEERKEIVLTDKDDSIYSSIFVKKEHSELFEREKGTDKDKSDTPDKEKKENKEKSEKKSPTKEKDLEKLDKRYSDREKKIKHENRLEKEKSELHEKTLCKLQDSGDKTKEKDRSSNLYSTAEKIHRENDKLKNMFSVKKPDEKEKSKEKLEKRHEREKSERERHSSGMKDKAEKEKHAMEKKVKLLEKDLQDITPSKAVRVKEKDRDLEKEKRKEKSRERDGDLVTNTKHLQDEKKRNNVESSKAFHEKLFSSKEKVKEDFLKTPDTKEKERKEKDRPKERVPVNITVKAKLKDVETDKLKSKDSSSAKDVRPKEKRLVNDDLMQTSFERMLSLKDLEIEQWHKKHKEKIKLKEKERQRHRSGIELTKLKEREKLKSSTASKELTRSKSSDPSEAHSKEKQLKDINNVRSLSTDAKQNLPDTSRSLISCESNLTASPRQERDRAGLTSRSVSMISVASSEDSCQTSAVATPRPLTDYDSDFTIEGSESQSSFPQSVFLSSAKSPAVYERDSDVLTDIPDRLKSPYSSKLSGSYLRSVSADGAKYENECRLVGDIRRCSIPAVANDHDKLSHKQLEGNLPPSSEKQYSFSPTVQPQVCISPRAEPLPDSGTEENTFNSTSCLQVSVPTPPAVIVPNSTNYLSQDANSNSIIQNTSQQMPLVQPQINCLIGNIQSNKPLEISYDRLDAPLHSNNDGYSASAACEKNIFSPLQHVSPEWGCSDQLTSELVSKSPQITCSEPSQVANFQEASYFSPTHSSTSSCMRTLLDNDATPPVLFWPKCATQEDFPQTQTLHDTDHSSVSSKPECAGIADGKDAKYPPLDTNADLTSHKTPEDVSHCCKSDELQGLEENFSPLSAALSDRNNVSKNLVDQTRLVHNILNESQKMEEGGTNITSAGQEPTYNQEGSELNKELVTSVDEVQSESPEESAEAVPSTEQTRTHSVNDDPSSLESKIQDRDFSLEMDFSQLSKITAQDGVVMEEVALNERRQSTESTKEESEEQMEADRTEQDIPQRITRNRANILANQSKQSAVNCVQLSDKDTETSIPVKTKPKLTEEEEGQVHHPHKRKMPRVPHPAQVKSTLQQAKEKTQQSLAAIVDSLKLEEIQPYHSEKANPYYEYLHIRKKIEEKRKVLCSVTPQAPQFYDEFVTFTGSYLLDGNPLSKLCIPTITPPPSLSEALKELFRQHEVIRMKLRLQHSIEREKLIMSNEQEVLRVHYRAARTLANQTLPFSACTVLLDAEVYNMPQDPQGDENKTSVRDRFNARQFMSWLQDVDDKFDKLKTCLLMRQQHEAAAMNAVQRLEWQLKLQELDPSSHKSLSIFEIPEFYIPLVDVNDDFDLTPI
ncbi:ankyrin repeat domain-containing protein 12 isoform X2 [Rhincodon typus]|uniref:ankyrin repeat domain-containing protein 12 isoform X2 n=1 Tax=Rhincodon typus TaxID=259920 RepID=UPI002030DC92|nr:ankyrin repeat domain-containing protein 12 isoform X2 [Rhincodon typus]